MIELTRRYDFAAAHVLARDDFSFEENRRVYGKCANPAGHGHNYGVELTVTGPIDERSGRIVDPALLDELFEANVGSRLGHSMLNDDPLFAERVPTAENIAIVIHELIEPLLAERSEARLVRVHVHETRNNSFVYGDA